MSRWQRTDDEMDYRLAVARDQEAPRPIQIDTSPNVRSTLFVLSSGYASVSPSFLLDELAGNYIDVLRAGLDLFDDRQWDLILEFSWIIREAESWAGAASAFNLQFDLESHWNSTVLAFRDLLHDLRSTSMVEFYMVRQICNLVADYGGDDNPALLFGGLKRITWRRPKRWVQPTLMQRILMAFPMTAKLGNGLHQQAIERRFPLNWW